MNFSSVQEAAGFLLAHRDCGKEADEAWDYLWRNMSQESREAIQSEMRRRFPELTPTHYDNQGNAYFEIGQVADLMGMSVDEVADILPDNGLDVADSRRLNRVQ